MYGDRFFRRRVKKYHAREYEIGTALYDLLKPTSVMDVGCALGSYLCAMQDRGAAVDGIEPYRDAAAPYIPDQIAPHIAAASAADDLSWWPRKYDLVLCIEVAEHIDRQYSQQLCRNLCGLSKSRILMTAAGPGQPGVGHVCLEFPSYWRRLMRASGGRYDAETTRRVSDMLAALGDPLRLRKNLMVFAV